MEKMPAGALSPQLKKPMDPLLMGGDRMALAALVNNLNSPINQTAGKEGGTVADAMLEAEGIPESASAVETQTSFAAPAPSTPQASMPTPLANTPRDIARVFYTGRLCVGKDHVAGASNARIVGFADPIYAVVRYFTGLNINSQQGKEIPGVRECLIAIGQWGRGEADAKYPITPARMLMTHTIRVLGKAGVFGEPTVDWEAFGRKQNLWLEALAEKVKDIPREQRLAITNVRFENEYKFFKAKGWEHYHVMCAPATWISRLAKRGLSEKSPVLLDTSEQMATGIDRDAIKQVSANKNGGKLHVIWNDDTPMPSRRLLTVAEYLQNNNPQPQQEASFASLE